MTDTSKQDAFSELPIGVDAMGGDSGLGIQVAGAIQAYKEFGTRSILFGPEAELRSQLALLGASELPLGVEHAPQIIAMSESPARAVRRKADSSLCKAYRALAEGRVSAMLSAGNSGAMMAAGVMTCGLIPGIERPAIASVIPSVSEGSPNVVLDTGANVYCHAENLVQFAVMGAVYYSALFGKPSPRVALLSNGSEASKGTDLVRNAAMMLSKLEMVNYVGYVEGRDVATQKTDVIVCDGFVGNIVLKTMEGCVRLVAAELSYQAKRGILSALGLFLMKGALRHVFRERFDYSTYGGSPLLGLQKLALVLHGSSDVRAVKNAIHVAQSFVKQGMTERISAALAILEERAQMSPNGLFNGVFKPNGDAVRKQTEELADSDD